METDNAYAAGPRTADRGLSDTIALDNQNRLRPAMASTGTSSPPHQRAAFLRGNRGSCKRGARQAKTTREPAPELFLANRRRARKATVTGPQRVLPVSTEGEVGWNHEHAFVPIEAVSCWLLAISRQRYGTRLRSCCRPWVGGTHMLCLILIVPCIRAASSTTAPGMPGHAS